MEMYDDGLEDVTVTIGGRTKRPSKELSGKEIAKRARLSSGGKIPMVACTHTLGDGRFCSTENLSNTDLLLNQEKFHASLNKVAQDEFISRFITVSSAQRHRTKEEERKKSRQNITTCYLMTGQSKLRVCKATFCSVLGISKDRVTRLAKYLAENKECRPELRGGRRNSDRDEEKREAVRTHIRSFKCKASHYSRKDSPGRKYLPHELSVAKMFQLFKEQNHLQISYSLYYSVFCGSFNLGFGSPATDVCATCTQFRNQIRSSILDDIAKKTLAAEFILHRRRQRCFYNCLNEVRDTTTICFDMMENLVLPRTPIGQVYYSRQVYLHVFGVVNHRADGSQKKEDIHLYTWLEWENGKDSNMVASAVQHFLKYVILDELETRSELRLFSDSCYGQNKNLNVLAMLLAFRKQVFPHLRITHTFPVRGHSFLPADRVFGRIEQEIRRHPTILLPEEYIEILSHHGNVHQYGMDWQSMDFKALTSKYTKRVRTFKISEVKVLEINGNAPGVKETYSGAFTVHPILKKGYKWENFVPDQLPPVSHVKPAKRTDTLKLLNELKPPASVVDFYNRMLGDDTHDNTRHEDSDRTDDSDSN